jgi:hypothetical protein
LVGLLTDSFTVLSFGDLNFKLQISKTFAITTITLPIIVNAAAIDRVFSVESVPEVVRIRNRTPIAIINKPKTVKPIAK